MRPSSIQDACTWTAVKCIHTLSNCCKLVKRSFKYSERNVLEKELGFSFYDFKISELVKVLSKFNLKTQCTQEWKQ